VPVESFPDYRVKARNTAVNSENAIHDDTVARQYGFSGGLVPGVTVYGYLTHPIVAALGPAWLERGTVTVRFLKPLLEGEELRVTGAIMTRDAAGVTASVQGSTSATPECATATVTLPAGLPTPINVSAYGVAPLPAERPPVSREHLLGLTVLGTPEITYDEECARGFLDKVSEPLALYRGATGYVHPAFYLEQGNRSIDRNVRLGPWIHVASTVRHLGAARVGDTLQTRGRVRSLFEKKGREFVEVDLAIFAGRRPVAHVLHTAIYRLPAPSA
jgi:acyl dehydratase